MRLSYIVLLALKNLYKRKMRTILTASGVGISVMFIVLLMSFGFGLQRVSINQITNVTALKILDVSITKSKILKIDDSVIKRFSDFSKVQSVKPQIVSATRIGYLKSEIDGVVYGKNPDYLKLEDIELTSGKIYNKNANEAIISKATLEQLGTKDMLNKELNLTIMVRSDLLNGDETSKEFQVKVKVVGILEDNSAPFIYLPLEVFKKNNVKNYSNAKILLKSKEDVDQTKMQIESLGYKVTSIKETVDQIKKFFNLFQIVLLFLGSIAVLIACIGMFNTMTINLIEKTREVGFMKVLGNTKKDIYKLFTIESIIIGLLGSLLGVIGGMLLNNTFNTIIYNMAQATGNKAEQLFYLPLYVPIVILLVSFIISLLTGLFPAHRASTIDPLNALRYE